MRCTTQEIDRGRPTGSRAACVALSLLGYAVWPIGAIAAAYALELIEHDWELGFAISGLFPLLLLPAQIVFQLDDTLISYLTLALWLGVWALATYLFLRRPKRWLYQWLFIGIVFVFSFGQSALGLLMLIGKHV